VATRTFVDLTVDALDGHAKHRSYEPVIGNASGVADADVVNPDAVIGDDDVEHKRSLLPIDIMMCKAALSEHSQWPVVETAV
jgi:hypothetical protein